MKKLIAMVLLAAVLAVCLCGYAAAESNVAAYRQKLDAKATWTRIDYNCVYTKNALSVLPDYLKYTTSLKSADCRLFGDETGEVWLIVESDVYRLWFSEEGYVVLTSTSDGLGYTGYAVFN